MSPTKKKLIENNEEDIRELLQRIESKITDSEESSKRFVDEKVNRLSERISELEHVVFETEKLENLKSLLTREWKKLKLKLKK